MSTSKESYKQIFKATTVFGGVQFFNIILSVIKSKIIAVLLGPAGLGVITLLNSTIGILGSITGFGLESSGIKSISEDFGTGNTKKLNSKILLFQRLILITSILGAVLGLAFSPLLSQLTFGNSDFTIAFVWLSLAILFRQLLSGHLTVLQSLGKLKHFAKANLYGNILSLIVTVPLYFYWRIDAIAPAIFLASAISFFFAFFFSKQHYTVSEKITFKTALFEGKPMLVLGVALTVGELVRTVSEYLVQIGISYSGGVDQVGLYGSGLMLLNSYVGILFVVISKNYYPKLAEVCNDNDKIKTLMDQQAYLSLLIVTPVIIIFIIAAPLIVQILFTQKFSPIIGMISWGIIGMIFKGVSWILGYIIVVKGDSKIYMISSIIFSMLYLVLLWGGYYVYGLTGLGISFLAYYVLYYLGIQIVVSRRYNLNLNREVYMLFLKCCLLCGGILFLTYLPWPIYKYILLVISGTLSCIYILFLLNKIVPLKELLTLFSIKKSD